MPNTSDSSIFNYDFKGFDEKTKSKKSHMKEDCCEKFKKKKDKHCKNCPNQ